MLFNILNFITFLLYILISTVPGVVVVGAGVVVVDAGAGVVVPSIPKLRHRIQRDYNH